MKLHIALPVLCLSTTLFASDSMRMLEEYTLKDGRVIRVDCAKKIDAGGEASFMVTLADGSTVSFGSGELVCAQQVAETIPLADSRARTAEGALVLEPLNPQDIPQLRIGMAERHEAPPVAKPDDNKPADPADQPFFSRGAVQTPATANSAGAAHNRPTGCAWLVGRTIPFPAPPGSIGTPVAPSAPPTASTVNTAAPNYSKPTPNGAGTTSGNVNPTTGTQVGMSASAVSSAAANANTASVTYRRNCNPTRQSMMYQTSAGNFTSGGSSNTPLTITASSSNSTACSTSNMTPNTLSLQPSAITPTSQATQSSSNTSTPTLSVPSKATSSPSAAQAPGVLLVKQGSSVSRSR